MIKRLKNAAIFLFLVFVGFTLRFGYWFRYQIKFEGFEKLTPEALNKPGGILFLPTHVAVFVEPSMIVNYLWFAYHVRPMVVEYMYKVPGFHIVMKNLRSVPVPNFDTGSNSFKKKRLTDAFDGLLEDLRKGDNFLIYPAARTKSSAREVIRSSGVHHILQEVPEANVVLVRIAGFWGSSYSRAITGKQPNPFVVLGDHIKYLFINLIFFTPRRQIVITVEPQLADFPWKANLADFNKYLEDWYNRPDGLSEQKGDRPGDSLILKSYSMWRREVPEIDRPDKRKDVKFDLRQVPDVLKERVLEKLSEMSGWNSKDIDPKMELFGELGLDSLDASELIVFLQDEFHVEPVPFHHLTTVAMMMGVASHHSSLLQHKKQRRIKGFRRWEGERARPQVKLGRGSTIPEVFLNQCERMGDKIACGDRFSGVWTYNDIKWRVLLLVEEIKKLPGDRVGVMMPAGPMAFVLAMSVQLAGKVPMMMNWTRGPGHLNSVLDLTKVETVLSSWNFVERLDNADFGGVDDCFVFYEDLYENLWLSDKMIARWRYGLKPETLLKKVGGYALNEDSQAVVVFTSGTEGRPKGVPLSHSNILSNMDACLEVFDLNSKDVILNILPPFHAFGFTLSGLLGLLAGIRVAFSSNLNDGYQMGLDIEKWKATIMFTIPTFLRILFRSAKPEQIQTLRLCMTGMEMASPTLLGLMKQAGKLETLIEGYGLSEATAVLTANRAGEPPKGDGLPLPGVSIEIVHPETGQLLPHGELGRVVAKGPSIFSGYLNEDSASPFMKIDGERWFVTGDLGYLNEQGYLTITDRLRRYIRIGGENVSMHAMELAVLQLAEDKGWLTGDEGPTTAIIADKKPGFKPKIHLFTRFDTTVIEVNDALKKLGFGNLARVVSVIKISELPLIGTGQINYPLLQEQLAEMREPEPKKDFI